MINIGVYANLNEDTMTVHTLAPALEARGVESFFMGEHTHTPVSTEPDTYHDAAVIKLTARFPSTFITLAMAAALTKNLRVGTSVCLLGQHDPLIFAKDIATLDALSGGRVVLGCGYGWNRAEMLNHGIDPRRRRTAFREKLRAVRMLWENEVAEFSGEFVSFSPSWSWPKPVQKPRLPILIGAPAKPELFGDIVELADGWMPSAFFAGESLNEQIMQLRRTAEQAGRSSETIQITMIESRTGMAHFSVAEFIERCPSADQLRRWDDMGISRIVIGVPANDESATMSMLDHIGGLVLQMRP